MSRKVVRMRHSPRPPEAGKAADAWVRGAAEAPLKRFTVEIDEALHRRLRVASALKGCTMSALVRELIERECPE